MAKQNLNTFWADLIVEELVRCGVDYFCISPGSRSTPLTVAVARNKNAKSIVCYDERNSAFHAVGYARASGKPAARPGCRFRRARPRSRSDSVSRPSSTAGPIGSPSTPESNVCATASSTPRPTASPDGSSTCAARSRRALTAYPVCIFVRNNVLNLCYIKRRIIRKPAGRRIGSTCTGHRCIDRYRRGCTGGSISNDRRHIPPPRANVSVDILHSQRNAVNP